MHEDLIKRLRNGLSCYGEKCLSCQDRKQCVTHYEHEAANVIEELPKWIPVAEQLPSAEKEVYVTDGEYIARANLLDEVFPGDKPCWSYSGLGEITHWCEQIPLPEPPEEGE